MSVYKIYGILYQVVNMKLFLSILLVILLSACQTIENKSEAIGKREVKEISKFIQQPESELKIVMGEPDEIKYDDKGSKFFIYKKKKIWNYLWKKIWDWSSQNDYRSIEQGMFLEYLRRQNLRK